MPVTQLQRCRLRAPTASVGFDFSFSKSSMQCP